LSVYSNSDPMSSDRWQRLNEIFHSALALDPAERSAFVDKACVGDDALRRESLAMLDAHERAELDLGAIERLDAALDEADDPGSPGLVGLRLGAYRISAEIGRGGMSSVWLADRVDGGFDQHVAIKVIKRGMDTAQVLEAFRAERQILASFDHPNVARLIDGGTTDDGLPYFVMEHIQGQPIDEYADEQRLSIQERLALFLQVCDAVSYAHQRLIVHRDIKPQNILVTASGVPKLLDFGIAKALQQAGDQREQGTHTLSGFRPLTPEYASPEQFEGRPTTTQTDVYSLGVVLYELLAGRSPYKPRTWNARDVGESALTADVERPSTAVGRPADDAPARRRTLPVAERATVTAAGSIHRLRGQLRGDLDAIVLTALRKETDRRYASVDHFAADIRRHMKGLPVRARPDSLSYRTAKFVRRNLATVAATVLVALALVGGAIATAWQAREARVQARLAHDAEDRAERRFVEVRKLANALLFDYHDAIKELPGATSVRARLVADALSYLNGLAQEAAGDASLQRELALAYRKVAEVQGSLADNASLGDTAGAIESHRKSLTILETLLAASPDDAQIQRDVADGTLELAGLLSMTDSQAEALDLASRARTLYEPLASEPAPTVEQRLALANAYDMLGVISLESGKAREALEIHERQLELLTSANADDQRGAELRRALSTAYQHMADAQSTFGDLDAALESHRRSLQLRIGLAAEFPYNTDYKRLVGVSHYWEADTLQHLGRTHEALAAYLRSLAIDDELAAVDPGAYRGTFALVRVGNTLDRLGDPRQALDYYDRAQAVLIDDLAKDSGNLWKRAGLIEVQAARCAALTRLARHAAAAAVCADAVTLIERTSVEPTNAVIRAALARSYKAMADAYVAASAEAGSPADQRLGQARAAVESYRKSVAIWSDMAALDMLTEADDQEAAAVSASLDGAETAVRVLTGGS
jgi:serine/threonine protein kinase/tetratricopeptide (TPR) repeat protein